MRKEEWLLIICIDPYSHSLLRVLSAHNKIHFNIIIILIIPDDVVPTIVATEAGKIAVTTSKGVRSITVAEGLLFSGFPKEYKLDNIEYRHSFDLLGNTVMPPTIKYVSECLLGANGCR